MAMILLENKLAFVCAAIAAAGIAAIFIIASLTEPAQISVSEAASQNSGKVKIAGFVDSVDVTGNRAIITIAGIQPVEAVSFDSGYIGSLGLKRFQEVEATGEFRSYNGKTSLIVTKVKPLNSTLGCGMGG